MPKVVLTTRGNCLCLGLLLTLAPTRAFGQSAAPLPKNPDQLLLLVQKQNRLTNADTPPWHLKISVKQLDPSGAPNAESQMEEFWAGPSKYKIVYTTSAGSSTQYGTANGLFQSAGTPIPPGLLMQAGSAFTNPVYESESIIDQWVLKRVKRKENGNELCLNATGIRTAAGKYDLKGSSFCLDPAGPTLLARSNPVPAGEAVYTRSNFEKFHGYDVPRDVELTIGPTRRLEAHLELLEDLAPSDAASLAPPPDAIRPRGTKIITVSPGISSGLFLRGDAPEYPLGAKMRGISGTVILQAKIGKDGAVSDLRVVSGPQELQDAAVAAVRTWRYRPYLLNGEPVEVSTRISVVFNLR